MSASPSRLVATASLLGVTLALGACRGTDPYYRHGVEPDAATPDDVLPNLTPDAATPQDASCPTCAVSVLYTCRTKEPNPNVAGTPNTDKIQASFVLDVTNQSNVPIDLAELTLRYWYTLSPRRPQALNCDFAQLGCDNVVTSSNPPPAPQPVFEQLMPPRRDANEYVEIAFTRGALALDPKLDTGDIQLRLHNQDLSLFDQTDDYSFDCDAPGTPVPSTLITAYVGGILVWGREPR